MRDQEDFEKEIRSHIEIETERLRKQGMSAADAERAARRTFGNTAVAGDRFYHGQRFVTVRDFTRDLRHAWRALLRTPAFLATSVLTLALAIGAVAGMFSVVNAVLLRPLPYPNPDRLVALRGVAPGSDMPGEFGLGFDFYFHWKENSKLIDGIFGFSGGRSTFRVENRVERIGMSWPMNDLWTTLGVQPILGRLPRPEDSDQAVVISDRLWSSWFARDPSVIGKTFFVSDGMKRVIGIMPDDFRFPSDETLLWVTGEPRLDQVRPGNLGLPLIARMKAGVTPDQLNEELTRLAKGLPARFGGPPRYARLIDKFQAMAIPPLDAMLEPTAQTTFWVLLGAVAIVLIIACANVANLFLVRAEGRRRDMAVRRAIGASRTQLVRFQMTEAFIVALMAGVLAIVLSTATLPLFVRAAPEGIPRLSEAGLDVATIAAAFGLVVLAALACGIVPALRASSPDLNRLRDGGRGSTGVRHFGRDLLVVGQTALSLVLLIGSALLVQSFSRLSNVDPGYDTKDIYTFQFAPERPDWRDGMSWGRMHNAFMDELRAVPGVQTVGVINNIPLDEGTNSWRFRSDAMTEEGGGTLLDVNFTGGDYFKAIGIELLQGRTFTADEAVTPNTSAIVSRSAAAKMWPNQNAVGQRLRLRFNPETELSLTVVGVVNDVKQDDWRESGEAGVYFPLTGPTPEAWGFGSPAYVVKSPRAESLKLQVREMVRKLAPEAPVYREYTMEFLARRRIVPLRFTMLTLAVVSALALVLGAIGLYGVLSYVVAQRTREIGVRMALGATSSAVRRMVVSQAGKVVVLGVVTGIGVAYWSTQFLQRLLFEVKPVDATVFAAMSLALVAVGALASYVPARRASRVDPIESLRSD